MSSGSRPSLYEFIVGTVGDPSRMAEATNEPGKYFADSVSAGILADEDRELLESGDAEAIKARLQDEVGVTRGKTKPIWILLIGGKGETS